MRKKNYKGRCEKQSLEKFTTICKTYDPIQSAYANILVKNKDISEVRCNVILDGECSEYLYYYLQYDLAQIASSTTKSTMIHVSMGSMKERPILLPSIEEQKRIADLISRFDSLCNSIKDGLPAEIEARQRQYEYYRDKLLTFKELSV